MRMTVSLLASYSRMRAQALEKLLYFAALFDLQTILCGGEKKVLIEGRVYWCQALEAACCALQVNIPLWALVHFPVIVTITTAMFTPKARPSPCAAALRSSLVAERQPSCLVDGSSVACGMLVRGKL